MKILLHCCCAPCSVSCIEPLIDDDFAVTLFWYNPNIHPFKEYEARRDCLIDYAKEISLPLIIDEDYGLRDFVQSVADDIDNRCIYCYTHRIEETAKKAKENGFEAFTSTLLASVYQDHELIKNICEKAAEKYGIKFLYKDFRPNFRTSNQKARDIGLYMQKYCGCIFSEEDRYKKKILSDIEKFK